MSMERITRRAVLKGTAGLSLGLVCTGASRREVSSVLTVFDSRLEGCRGGDIDIVKGEHHVWNALRSVSAQRIAGHLRWSEFVFVRGLVEERGHRLASHSLRGSVVSFEFRRRNRESA